MRPGAPDRRNARCQWEVRRVNLQEGVHAELCPCLARLALSGAADLIASRIPPGHIDWVVGGWVVFFVFVVFSVFPVFVGLVAFLLCC